MKQKREIKRKENCYLNQFENFGNYTINSNKLICFDFQLNDTIKLYDFENENQNDLAFLIYLKEKNKTKIEELFKNLVYLDIIFPINIIMEEKIEKIMGVKHLLLNPLNLMLANVNLKKNIYITDNDIIFIKKNKRNKTI
jgi:hypothetical protein